MMSNLSSQNFRSLQLHNSATESHLLFFLPFSKYKETVLEIFPEELLRCGTDSRLCASQNNRIFTFSNQRLIVFFRILLMTTFYHTQLYSNNTLLSYHFDCNSTLSALEPCIMLNIEQLIGTSGLMFRNFCSPLLRFLYLFIL